MNYNRKYLPKPEILVSPELRPTASKFQRQIWVFRPRRARRNCSPATATKADNRKWQYRRFGRQSCHFGCLRCRNHLVIIYQASRGRKSRTCRWNFYCICHTFGDINTSGFGGHIAFLVVCRLRSYCLWDRHGRFAQDCSWKVTK